MVDLLVILVLLGAVVLFVSAPLRRVAAVGAGLDAPPGNRPQESELGELEAARDAKLRELRDAELDHRTGKLSDEDFADVDQGLRHEAVEILRDLDAAREASGGEGDTATIRD